LEEKDGGHGLVGDFQVAKDGDHLVGELADFGGLPLLQVRNRQIQGHERGVALSEKRLADLGQEPAGLVVVSKAGGYPPLYPIPADAERKWAAASARDRLSRSPASGPEWRTLYRRARCVRRLS